VIAADDRPIAAIERSLYLGVPGMIRIEPVDMRARTDLGRQVVAKENH